MVSLVTHYPFFYDLLIHMSRLISMTSFMSYASYSHLYPSLSRFMCNGITHFSITSFMCYASLLVTFILSLVFPVQWSYSLQSYPACTGYYIYLSYVVRGCHPLFKGVEYHYFNDFCQNKVFLYHWKAYEICYHLILKLPV